MSNRITCAIATLALALAAPMTCAEDDPNMLKIKARKGEMQVRAYHVTPLFLMAKGKIPYDAEAAANHANNLKMLLGLDMSGAWPQGTSLEEYPEKTFAKPDIWTTWPHVAEEGKEYAEAVEKLAAAAGGGLDSLRGAIGDVGDGCKGCHDDFREKE